MTDLVIGRDKNSTSNDGIRTSDDIIYMTLANVQPEATVTVPPGASLMKIQIEQGKRALLNPTGVVTYVNTHVPQFANFELPENGAVRRVTAGDTMGIKTLDTECLVVVQFYKK